jgi:hypothetical protein
MPVHQDDDFLTAFMRCPRCHCPDIRPIRTTVSNRRDVDRVEHVIVHDDLSIDRQPGSRPLQRNRESNVSARRVAMASSYSSSRHPRAR